MLTLGEHGWDGGEGVGDGGGAAVFVQLSPDVFNTVKAYDITVPMV